MMRATLFGASAALMMLIASPSQATLFELENHGDYTLDTVTGLQWLAPGLTRGLAYTTMVGSLLDPSYQYYGYRYANGAEVSQFFQDALGITSPVSGPLNAATIALANAILQFQTQFIGGTEVDSHFSLTKGIIADKNTTTGERFVSELGFCLPGYEPACDGFGVIADPYYRLIRSDESDPTIGSFLVRNVVTPIPNPPTLLLISSGVGALGLLSWRRKRKVQAFA
jgi:hypothetical protein